MSFFNSSFLCIWLVKNKDEKDGKEMRAWVSARGRVRVRMREREREHVDIEL